MCAVTELVDAPRLDTFCAAAAAADLLLTADVVLLTAAAGLLLDDAPALPGLLTTARSTAGFAPLDARVVV